MKKIIFILSLFLAGSAFADATNILRLRNVGLSQEVTREIDAIYATGSAVGEAWNTITPISSPTPGLGANQLQPGRNVVPPTATANTAVFVGPTTPIPGQRFIVVNPSTATVRLKAAGAATMNLAGSAGGWVDLPTLRKANCETITATSQLCDLAPALPTPQ